MPSRVRIEEICLAALQARDYREAAIALTLLRRGLDDYPGDPALLIELADLARDPRCRRNTLRRDLLRTLESEARAAGDAPIAYELWMASAELRRDEL